MFLIGAWAAILLLPMTSAGAGSQAVRAHGGGQTASYSRALPADAKELVVRRTATSRTWQLDSGEKVTRVYAQPVNTRDNSGWAAIDDSLVPASVPGFAYENRNDAYTARIPRTADGTVRFAADGDWLEFTPLGTRKGSLGNVEGDSATYPSALPGVDLRYEATTEGIRETLRLANAAARAHYAYKLSLSDGLTLADGPSGALEIRKHGATVFSFAAPVIYDAAGEKAEGPHGQPISYVTERHGSDAMVRLNVDRGWLSDRRRAFPVTVDPTVSYVNGFAVLNGALQDTFIQSNTPDANYNASTYLEAGWTGSPLHEQRALLKFDVNGAVPKDSVVFSAQLSAYLESAQNANPANLVAREVGRSWTEAATWNRYDGVNAWSTPGAQIAGAASAGVLPTPGWNSWNDLQGMAQRWVDGTTPNNGLLLAPENSTNPNDYKFTASNGTSSQVPYLQIRYDERYGTSERYMFWHPDGSVTSGQQPDFQGATGMPPVNVNVANGNLMLNTLDRPYSAATPGIYPVSRTYNSVWWGEWGHGLGWTSNSSTDYTIQGNADGSVDFEGPSHPPVRFAKIAAGFAPSTEADATLAVATDGTGEYYVTFNETGERFVFGGLNYVLRRWTDSAGNTTKWAYTVDASGNATTATATDATGSWTKWFFDNSVIARRIAKVQTSDGKTYQYGYDAYDNLVTYTGPDGSTTRYTYDTAADAETPRRLLAVTAPDGSQTKFTYSGPWGRRQVATYTTRAAGATVDGPTWRFSYGSGQTTVTSPAGVATTYTWDASMRATGSATGANPPTASLSGSLYTSRNAALATGTSYALTVNGQDGSSTSPSQGVKSVEILIDDERADYVEQTCAAGSCALSRTYTLRTDDYGQGVHVVTTKVTDLGGAVRTQTFTINVDHADSEDPMTAPAGDYGPADDGPPLADDPANPVDEGTNTLGEKLTCSAGTTVVEEHNSADAGTFLTAQAAFTDYLSRPENATMPASAFVVTYNLPTAVTYTASQNGLPVGIVDLYADSAGKWGVEGMAACGSFVGEAAPSSTTATAAATTCPTVAAASRPFYLSIYCKAFQDVDYHFESNYPKGRRRDRVVEGGRAWNDAPGTLFFRAHRKDDIATGGRCNRKVASDPEAVGVIKWGHIDGPGHVLGFAGVCSTTGASGKPDQAQTFFLKLDSEEKWYYRSGRGKPKSFQTDMRSIATHEMGHATGWAPHLDDAKPKSYCANVRYQQTMCKFNYTGTTWQRSLGSRDTKIFRGAYGR